MTASPTPRSADARAPGPLPDDGSNPPENTIVYQRPRSAGSRFVILRPHAKGGLGEVFVALDEELQREVALKEIQDTYAQDTVSRARFVLEAEITGRLEHPAIVPVYGFGQHDDGRPYYAMRFIQGDSLKTAIRRFHKGQHISGGERAVEFRKLLGAFVDVCQAIHYAHCRGILHRDLKPENIMLGKFGETLVVDWGLAKPLAESTSPTERTGLGEQPLQPLSGSGPVETLAGTALGTPGYMSPEQAVGRLDLLGPRSDIYSLGATLYCLLTGQAPFGGTEAGEVLQKVQKGDFPPPRSVTPHVPLALEAVCLKAMALEPADRYTSARDLALDLEHWLADEPVSAYREPPSARLGRSGARHRPLVTGAAALLLTAVAALSLGVLLLGRANTQIQEERDRAESQHKKAVSHLYYSLVGEAQAIRRARESGYRTKVFNRLTQALQLDTPSRDPLELRQEAAACLGDFVGLEPTIWEEFPTEVIRAALHPDGTQLAVGLADGTVLLRHIPAGEQIASLTGHSTVVTALAFRAGGKELVSADWEGNIKVWQRSDAGTWTCSKTIFVEPVLVFMTPSLAFPFFTAALTPRYIAGAALTPDERYLAVCSHVYTTIVLVDLADGRTAARFLAPEGEKIVRLALSPDGKLLAGGYLHNGAFGVLVWDVATRALKQRLLPELEFPMMLSFSPDGKLLACVHSEGVALYDTSTFQRLLFLRVDNPSRAAFSRDSQLLAIYSWQLGLIRLWNISTNHVVAALSCPDAFNEMALEFGKDDKILIAAAGKSVRTWSLAGASEKLVLVGHTGGVCDVVFSPDGKLLASAGKDHKIKIWDAVTGTLVTELTDFSSPVQTLCFSPEGRILAAGDYEKGTVLFYDVESWKKLDEMRPQVGLRVFSIAFSPDGQTFAAGGRNGLTLWRVVRGGAERPAGKTVSFQRQGQLAEGYSSSICFSPDGNWLAWVDGWFITPKGIRLWDLRSGQPHALATARSRYGISALSFYPDSKHLAFVSDKPAIAVWDVTRKQEAFSFGAGEGELERRGALPPHTRLSADGTWYAIGGRAVTVWDMAAKKLLVVLPERRSVVWSVGWSPNHELLAVGTSDGGLVIWNLPKINARLAEIGLGW